LLSTVSNAKIVHVRYFVEIHELQTELSVFEARGVANFGTRCRMAGCITSINPTY